MLKDVYMNLFYGLKSEEKKISPEAKILEVAGDSLLCV